MRLRVSLLLAVAVALCVGVATATAAGGGNSANAKLCQKGGWQTLGTSTGQGFANESACVSYAAKGGTLTPLPDLELVVVSCALSGTIVFCDFKANIVNGPVTGLVSLRADLVFTSTDVESLSA